MPFRLLLAVLAAACLTCSPAFAQDDTWKLMLQKNYEELQYQAEYVDGVAQALPALIKQTRQDIAALRKKLDELQVLARVSGSNPLELRSVVAGLDILSKQVADAARPLKQIEADFKRFQERLAELEAEFSPQAADMPSQELARALSDFMAELKKTRGKLGRVKTVLDQGLNPTRDLEANIGRSAQNITDRLPKARSDYYLAPGKGLLSLQAWNDAAQRLTDLPKFFLMYSNLFDTGHAGANDALARLAGLSAFLIVASFALLYNLKRKLPWLSPISRPMALLTWTSLSAAVIWATSGPAFVLVHSVTGAVAEIFQARAMLGLAWFLRGLQLGDTTPRRNPVAMSWWMFALATLLQLPWLPEALRGAVWVVALLVAGVWTKRRFRKQTGSAVEALAKQSAWVLPALALPTLFGWLNLTLLIAMGWFLALVFLQAGLGVNGLLARLVDKPGATPGETALRTLAAGLVLPVTVTAMGGLALLWLCSNVGGKAAFAAVIDYDLGRGGFSMDIGRAVVILTAYCLAKALSRLADQYILTLPDRRPDLEKGVANLLDTTSTYVIWGLFAITALYLVGADFTSLAVVAGGLSVGIGFGMQHIINNFISGLILLFGRSIQVGDTLQIGDIWGVVQRVNIRNTVVQTSDNATLFVPNSELIAQKIINWSHRDRRVRRSVDVGVVYGSDTRKVQELLLQAAAQHPNVLREPKPGVVFAAFGDTALQFKLMIWINDVDNAGRACSDVRLTVERLFRENGVEVPAPLQAQHAQPEAAPQPEAAAPKTEDCKPEADEK